MNKVSYIYILTNATNRVLYVGVTADLIKRVYEHKQKSVKGFTQKYHVDKLVYYEEYSDIIEAIKREKQLKGGSREKKLLLVEKMNPLFTDLYQTLM